MRQRATADWWTAGPRRRLLVEDPRAVWFADFSLFREAGLEVAVCTGPDGSAGGDGSSCPLLDGGRCELLDAAEVVLCGLDLDDPSSAAVLKLARASHPETPTVVEVPAQETPTAPPGCIALRFPASVEAQVRVVSDAARHPTRS